MSLSGFLGLSNKEDELRTENANLKAIIALLSQESQIANSSGAAASEMQAKIGRLEVRISEEQINSQDLTFALSYLEEQSRTLQTSVEALEAEKLRLETKNQALEAEIAKLKSSVSMPSDPSENSSSASQTVSLSTASCDLQTKSVTSDEDPVRRARLLRFMPTASSSSSILPFNTSSDIQDQDEDEESKKRKRGYSN